MSWDISAIRKDFPIFDPVNHSGPLAFLDSAASAQKPRAVIEAMAEFSSTTYANVHRGAYELSQRATNQMEGVRQKVADFIGAQSAKEIVFTKNATESLNLLASSFAAKHLRSGDVVVLSVLEHHANIVPWQIQAQRYGFQIRYIECDSQGRLDTSDLDRLLDGAKLLSITAMSNVTGAITDIETFRLKAEEYGVQFCLDASQLIAHQKIDVQAFGCDYLVFTGHKLCGPTGVGVLWAKRGHLEELPVFLGGGAMITTVTRSGFTPAPVPAKFEAGTPPIEQIIGLGAAISYLESISIEAIEDHCKELSEYFLERATENTPDFVLYGSKDMSMRGPVFSFGYKDIHPHDLAQVLDSKGVCVRAGHHCAKPLMDELNVAATTRASLYLYNTRNDIDRLFQALKAADTLFGF